MTRHQKSIALAACLLFCGIAPPSAAQVAGSTSTVATTQSTEGERALDLGEYPRAEQLFQDDLKRVGKDDPNRAYYQVGLSEALINQGKFSEATKEYKKAQQLVEATDSKNELAARLYDGLSWLYHAQGKFDDAIDYAQKAVATRKTAANPSGMLMVSSLTHLGHLMEIKGQLDGAAKYYKDALGLQDQIAGPNSLTAADLMENIGSIMRRQGDSAGTKRYFETALQIKLNRNAILAPYAPHAYWETVTFPFIEGSPNCARRFDQGAQQLIITANGVTIALSLKPVDATKTTQVNVAVRNDTSQEVQFLPIPPSLTMTRPKIFMAPQVDPNTLGQTIEKKGDRKAAWIRFWGNNATQTISSTSIGQQPGFFGYPPIYGMGMGGMGMMPGSYNSWSNRGSNMSFMTMQVPDYAAQERALQRAADVSDQAHQRGNSIKTSGLGPTGIPPGQSINGSLYFDAPKMTDGVVRIPVGNAVFEFDYPPR